MTRDEAKAHAERIIRQAVEGIDSYAVLESFDFSDDAEQVADLVFGATVTVTFDD